MGSPVLLNAGEMQWIADNLFVGNKLTSGEIETSTGVRVDLRNIKSPIVVLCSWGDNITPPQQALGWITDLYGHDNEIVANGQTIVYTLHQTIGHLGIFVSGKVASREHAEFASAMEMIDLMPPGLYEAVIDEVAEGTERPDLIHGKYLFRLEARTLDDIRALGANSEDDDKRFATVARVSEINQGLYRTLLQPAVKAMANDQSAEAMRELHPNRLRFSLFSERNPFMAPIPGVAEQVRAHRQPVAPDNPLLALEKVTSTWLSTCWEGYRQMRDAATEAMFLGTYGSPVLQAMVGLGNGQAAAGQRIARDLLREADEARMRADLAGRFDVGGLPQATLRALIYVRLPQGSVDERGYAMLKAIRAMQPANDRMSLADLKAVVREQYLLLRLDEERAVRAIPRLLPDNEAARRAGLAALHSMLEARGPLPEEAARRLSRIEALFGLEAPSKKVANA